MASERMLLLSPSLSDAASFAASSELSTLGVINAQNIQPKKVWRTNSTTGQFLTVDFGSAVPANALAIVGHNLSGNATLRVRAAASAAAVTAAPPIDTAAQSAWPSTGKPTIGNWPNLTSLLKWTNGTAYRYWRVDFADPSPLATYLDFGRIVLGAYWQPSINFDLGGTPLGFAPTDIQTATPYGYTFPDRRAESAPRLFELQCYAVNQREALDGIYEIQRLRGLWGDVICCLDPGATTDFHRYVMQGCFTAGGSYPLPPAFDSDGNMFGVGIKLREFL